MKLRLTLSLLAGIALGLLLDPIATHANATRRMLVSIQFSLHAKEQLCWDVAFGKKADFSGEYVIDRLDKPYCIDPHAATMTYDGETRGFDKETAEREAAALLGLLYTLSRYAIDSTEWWLAGKGERREVASLRGQ